MAGLGNRCAAGSAPNQNVHLAASEPVAADLATVRKDAEPVVYAQGNLKPSMNVMKQLDLFGTLKPALPDGDAVLLTLDEDRRKGERLGVVDHGLEPNAARIRFGFLPSNPAAV